MEKKNFDDTPETSEVTTETAQIDGISADNDTCTNSSTADKDTAESTTESVHADSDTEIAPVEHKKRNKKKVGNEKPADDSEIAAQVENTNTALDVTTTPAALPTLETLTKEIGNYIDAVNTNLSMAAQNIIEVGKRLIQAKSLVKHGNWAKWLDSNFELSQDTAENYIKLAKRFSTANSESFRNLKQSQMIAMLALPAGEEENFIDEQKSEGNDVEKMTARQVKKAVKDYKAKTQKTVDAPPVKIVENTAADTVTIDTQATITGADSSVDDSDTVTLALPKTLYRDFCTLAKVQGSDSTALIVDFMQKYIDDNGAAMIGYSDTDN